MPVLPNALLPNSCCPREPAFFAAHSVAQVRTQPFSHTTAFLKLQNLGKCFARSCEGFGTSSERKVVLLGAFVVNLRHVILLYRAASRLRAPRWKSRIAKPCTL